MNLPSKMPTCYCIAFPTTIIAKLLGSFANFGPRDPCNIIFVPLFMYNAFNTWLAMLAELQHENISMVSIGMRVPVLILLQSDVLLINQSKSVWKSYSRTIFIQ